MIGVIMILLFLLYLNIMVNSLNMIVISGIILILAYKFKNMYKKASIFYIFALLIATLSLVFNESEYFRYFTSGLVGYGFLFTVMITGVFPSRLTLTKNLRANRGMFSILSFILISPHAIGHAFGIFGSIDFFGIGAYVLMVPLTIISFKIIRREIEPKDWFTIQKAAYLIYLILFVHLMFVASWDNRLVYAIIFTLYINNKIIKEFKK